MKAYHFLMGNMETGSGTEGPWTIGEEREIEGDLGLCCRGYHSSKSWLDTLNYAPGAMACIVDIPDSRHGTIVGNDKQVSPRRKLLAARDATQVLQLFACDCAERALRIAGVANEELWAIMRVARLYVNGEVGEEELKAARAAYAATDPYFAADAANAACAYAAARARAARVYADARTRAAANAVADAARATAATARAAYAAAYTAANVVADAMADATARVANAAIYAARANTVRAATAVYVARANAARAVDAAIYAARANATHAADAAADAKTARAVRARAKERTWQRRRLDWYMKKLFEEV